MWCVRSFTHLRIWLFLLLLTKQWECGIFQVCVKFFFKLFDSQMKFFIPEYMDRMSDIKFKWYHCEMKSCYWKRDLNSFFFLLLLISGLRKKTVAPGTSGLDEHLKSPGHTELFGQSDAIVKHVLEVQYFPYFMRPKLLLQLFTGLKALSIGWLNRFW